MAIAERIVQRSILGAVALVTAAATVLALHRPIDASAETMPQVQQAHGPYHIGVFYFPGWKDNQLGAPSPKPWAAFKSFPDRIPLAGAYQEGDSALLIRQLRQMHDAGLSFVAFDGQFLGDGTPLLGDVVNRYLKLPASERSGMGFAILWANHSRMPQTPAQFEAIVRYWIHTYMRDPDYLRIDGRPQLFVVSTWWLTKNAAGMNVPVNTLLDRAQEIAREEGLPGIDFVAGDPSQPDQVATVKAQGYSGITAYGYHRDAAGKMSHSFAEFAANYAADWAMLANSAAPMRIFLPMSAGWDRRAWGGSPDSLHDQSRSTPAEFKAHLEAGRAFIAGHPQLTDGYGMVCCWNEFGEGSFIEPTVGDDGGHLAAVKAVFGGNH